MSQRIKTQNLVAAVRLTEALLILLDGLGEQDLKDYKKIFSGFLGRRLASGSSQKFSERGKK